MAQQPQPRAALVAVLLTAFLAGGTALASAAAAAPRDPSPAATGRPGHGTADDKADKKHEDAKQAKEPAHSRPSGRKEPAEPVAGPTAPTKPTKPRQHATRTGKKADAPTPLQGDTGAQPVTAPVVVPLAQVPAAPLPGLLTGQPPAPSERSPFLRTARPFRPLSVVRPPSPLWQVHDPAERTALLRVVHTVTGDPTTLLVIAALTGLFLLVQNRIDRNDPKLSRGHREDPPDLRFGPARRLQTAL